MVSPGLVTLRDRMESILSEETLSPPPVSVCLIVMLMCVFNVTFSFESQYQSFLKKKKHGGINILTPAS